MALRRHETTRGGCVSRHIFFRGPPPQTQGILLPETGCCCYSHKPHVGGSVILRHDMCSRLALIEYSWIEQSRQQVRRACCMCVCVTEGGGSFRPRNRATITSQRHGGGIGWAQFPRITTPRPQPMDVSTGRLYRQPELSLWATPCVIRQTPRIDDREVPQRISSLCVSLSPPPSWSEQPYPVPGVPQHRNNHVS